MFWMQKAKTVRDSAEQFLRDVDAEFRRGEFQAASVQAIPTTQQLLASFPGLYQQYQQLSGYAASQDLQAMLKAVLMNQNAILGQLAAISKQILPGPITHFTFKEIKAVDFPIGFNQYQDIAVGGVDDLGKPVLDPNTITATSSDPTIATVTPSPSTVTPPDKTVAFRAQSAQQNAGTATITVTDGTVTGSFTVTVAADGVVSLNEAPIGSPQTIGT